MRSRRIVVGSPHSSTLTVNNSLALPASPRKPADGKKLHIPVTLIQPDATNAPGNYSLAPLASPTITTAPSPSGLYRVHPDADSTTPRQVPAEEEITQVPNIADVTTATSVSANNKASHTVRFSFQSPAVSFRELDPKAKATLPAANPNGTDNLPSNVTSNNLFPDDKKEDTCCSKIGCAIS